MNNSLARLIDGMIEALRTEVIPATQGAFARGQAFGVIFMLETLKLRADWSDAYRGELHNAVDALRTALSAIVLPEGVAPFPIDATAVEAADAWVCDTYDRLEGQAPQVLAVRRLLDEYVHRCLRHEIGASARPMFAEISLGQEEARS
jgi:hypothetical protein